MELESVALSESESLAERASETVLVPASKPVLVPASKPVPKSRWATDAEAQAESLSVFDTHTNLKAAKACVDCGDLIQAESLFRICLIHVEEKYGSDSLDVAYVGNDMADVLEKVGKKDESNNLLARMRAIVSKAAEAFGVI